MAGIRGGTPLAIIFIAVFGSLGCGGGISPMPEGFEDISFAEESLDFGKVLLYSTTTKTIEFRNRGTNRVAMSLESAPSGFEAPESFSVSPEGNFIVQIRFRPEGPTLREGVIVFRSHTGTFLEVRVLGQGVPHGIQVDPVLVDFGSATRGGVVEREIKVRSLADQTMVVRATFEGSEAFQAKDVSFTVGAQEEVPVRFSFAPGTPGLALGSMKLATCVGCEELVVLLRGLSLASGVVTDPASMDFGEVHPGLWERQLLQILNAGDHPVEVASARAVPLEMSPFVVEPFEGKTLQPKESMEIAVVFLPGELKESKSSLLIENGEGRAVHEIPLSGVGKGPFLTVAPTSLDFGRLLQGEEVFHDVDIRLSGTEESVEIVEILVEGADGFFVDEVTTPIRLENGATTTVRVGYRPVAGGPSTAGLVVRTSSRVQPVVGARLDGFAYDICELVVQPAGELRLGVVSGYQTWPIAFEISHHGQHECLMWGAGFPEGTQGFRLLDELPDWTNVLRPGETRTVKGEVMDLGEDAPGWVRTTFEFSHSTLETPRHAVEVSAYRVTTPMAISPEFLSFRDTPVGRISTLSLGLEMTSHLGEPTLTSTSEAFSLLAPAIGRKNLSIGFTPTSEGEQRGFLELWFEDFEEAFLVPADGKGIPPCSGCEWPEIGCDEVEIVERPVPLEGWDVRVLSDALDSGWECDWFLLGSPEPTVPHEWSTDPADGCRYGSFTATEPGAYEVKVVAWDSAERGASCNVSFEVPQAEEP